MTRKGSHTGSQQNEGSALKADGFKDGRRVKVDAVHSCKIRTPHQPTADGQTISIAPPEQLLCLVPEGRLATLQPLPQHGILDVEYLARDVVVVGRQLAHKGQDASGLVRLVVLDQEARALREYE